MAGQRADHTHRSPISPSGSGVAHGNTDNTNTTNPNATQKVRESIQEPVPSDGRPGSSGDDVPIRSQEGDDVEGVRTPVVLKAPHRVTQAEREAHEVTHMPYRSWCPHCVRGRGRNTPHRQRAEEAKVSGVPKIAMDYMFMSAEDERASSNPVLVVVDEATGERYARAVGHKGTTQTDLDWLVKDVCE